MWTRVHSKLDALRHRIAVRHCRQRLGFLRRRRSDNSISVRPDRAQAQQWAASFVNLVNSKYGVALFRAFLSQEFADENLEFWLAVEDFKKTRHSKMAAKALQIYNEFLVTQAPREINVDSATRTAIQSGLSAPDAHLFDAAQRRVQHLMESDIFPRFLQSPMYQELLRDEQGKSRARR
ncbi:regulator of G-protein signaling 8-like isoform X3 [Amphibalanus amphitrite]|uniref:regulator of G-protein signaling 8-like isoform X3 n=1 Tax=Amphibalanus amphitrite TaxID=1232801 RepID=UPI001C91E16F|nr:regulator of G-protein signaling 8-like isoform X3 [Amphibalanus amphitrite]XP_043214468.1 regulator of G-protein signaling 8-like isoform X3 [Amphibalanus amphitrite]